MLDANVIDYSCIVQTEFSTVYKTKPTEMSNPQKLEEYRQRWTRDTPGPLRDQRFETENTFVNDKAAGQGTPLLSLFEFI